MSDITKELDDVLKRRQTNGYHVRRIAGQARDEIERLRSWQKDAIDRIKVYINVCDHQRVTGEYMSPDACVYCALARSGVRDQACRSG